MPVTVNDYNEEGKIFNNPSEIVGNDEPFACKYTL